VFGGAPAEHEVSIRSAEGVVGALRAAGHRLRLLGIDRPGHWHDLSEVSDLAITRPVRDNRPGPRLELFDGVGLVFPLVHGYGGEDGRLQGALDLWRIPYVGCGPLSSALAMDKAAAGLILAAQGLPVVPTSVASSRAAVEMAVAFHGYPCFIKPRRGGSSVGAAHVERPSALPSAMSIAFEEDDEVLVQPLQRGAEVSIGILEHPQGGPRASLASILEQRDQTTFFDYQSKYGGDSLLTIPADLTDSRLAECQRIAVAAFAALGGTGFARVDLFVNDDSIVINEINTIPGMAEGSHYPRLWRASGVAYGRLLELLIEGGRREQRGSAATWASELALFGQTPAESNR
jgi:D-alanine-D-alanine ligase